MRTLILAALISNAFADCSLAEVTGDHWMDYCAAIGEQTPKYALCVGYLSGALDGIRFMQKVTGTIILCEPPDGVSISQ